MSQRKSLESWPMPNLLKDDTTSSSGSSEEILSKKSSTSTSTLPAARRRQTISDLKKKNIQKNGPNFVTRRRKSISSEVKISFKDTLLRRRRYSTSFPTTMSSINQHAYLEILRDLSIEDDEPSLTIATDISNVSLSNNNNNNIPTTTMNDADDGDVEPFTLTHEDDDSLYDDIADAISSL